MDSSASVGGTILVTGVSGLIGRAVAARLSQLGQPVLGLDRQRPTDPPCAVLLQEIGDTNRLHEVMRQRPVDAIVHAGGISGPMVLPDAPSRVSEINIGGLVDVLEAARIHGVRRVVWFSSILAYGRQPPGPVREDAVLRPDTVYAATKVAGEALLQAYAEAHGVDGVALRVASCYGPGRTTDCFVRLLVENARAGRPTEVPDPAARTRQHIHVEDVVKAVMAALAVPRLVHRIYNIAPGIVQSSAEVAAEVARAVEGVRLACNPAAAAWNSFALGPLDITRARQDLGFAPAVDLAEGAASYLRWIEAAAAAGR